MFMQDKIKQTMYHAIVKIINFSNNVHSNSKQSE
jgi:type III secretion system FlhB-like substrate exporter